MEIMYRPIEEIKAAMSFVKTMVPKADGNKSGIYPLWHGWALQDAFWAGIEWERKRQSGMNG